MKITYKHGVFTIEITEDELTEITPSDILQMLRFELTKVKYKRFWDWLRSDSKVVKGCFNCNKAQWDMDGCTCELTGLLVGNVSIGCEHRKRGKTNG